MIRTLLFASGLLLAACTQVESAQTSPSEDYTSVPVEAAQYSGADAVKLAQFGGGARLPAVNHFPVKRCMNMGNALESSYEGEWGYTIRERDFHTIAKAGFDTVRIPVRWDEHISANPPYKIDPARMQRVIDVVGQAQGAGLGVIIDVHHYRDLSLIHI